MMDAIDRIEMIQTQDELTLAVGVITTLERAAVPLWTGMARWDPRRSSGGFDAPNASTDVQSQWVVTPVSTAMVTGGFQIGDLVRNEGGRRCRIVRVSNRDDGWLLPELLVSAEEVSRSATMIVLYRRDAGGVVSPLDAQAFVVALQATRPAKEQSGQYVDSSISGERATIPATLRGSATANIRPSDRFEFEGHWGRIDSVRVASDGEATEATATINWGAV